LSREVFQGLEGSDRNARVLAEHRGSGFASYPKGGVLILLLVPVIAHHRHIRTVGGVPCGHNEAVLLKIHPYHPSIRSMTSLPEEQAGVGMASLVTSVSIEIPNLFVVPHDSSLLGAEAALRGDGHHRTAVYLHLVRVTLYGEGVISGEVVTVKTAIYSSWTNTVIVLCCDVEAVLKQLRAHNPSLGTSIFILSEVEVEVLILALLDVDRMWVVGNLFAGNGVYS